MSVRYILCRAVLDELIEECISPVFTHKIACNLLLKRSDLFSGLLIKHLGYLILGFAKSTLVFTPNLVRCNLSAECSEVVEELLMP